MVTASHNPPQDNGYKVYLGDGSQIVPPADAEIAARIAAVGSMADLPRGTTARTLGEDIVDRYLDDVGGAAPRTAPATCRSSTHPSTGSAAPRSSRSSRPRASTRPAS